MTDVCQAAYQAAPLECGGATPSGLLKRGTANCQNVAAWVGIPREKGVFLLFAFDKNGVYHENQHPENKDVLKMLARLDKSNGKDIYYD